MEASGYRSATSSTQSQSKGWWGYFGGEYIDDLTLFIRKANQGYETVVSTVQLIFTGFIIFAVGYYSLSLLFQTKLFKRYFFLNHMINKTLSVPKCFPVYVEHKKTIDNLKRHILKGSGVLLLCGLQVSGKSSYARNACNELLVENKIHGIVDILQGSYGEGNNDGGSAWFNSNVKYEGLLDKNEDLSNIFGKNTDPQKTINNTNKLSWTSWMVDLLHLFQSKLFTKKRYVILLDQFEKNNEHSETEKFLTFVVKMAENAIYHDTYCVLICLSDPLIASKIYKKNGGAKIAFTQNYSDLKWTTTEIDTFYKAVKDDVEVSGFTADMKDVALEAGTAGFCKDLHRNLLINAKERSLEIKNGWESNSDLLKKYLRE
jgi:hypothetical protein